MATRKWRLYSASVAALALAGVAVFPVTSWVVRQEATMTICGLLPLSQMLAIDRNKEEKAASAARARPNDFPIQLALAMREGRAAMKQSTGVIDAHEDRSEIVARLTKLDDRFPNEPSLYAAILRNLSNKITLDSRNDAAVLDPAQPVRVLPQPSRAASIEAFEAAASTGERLDPNNAFFAMERAVALFAANHDTEACSEMIRAGKATRFDDYMGDETTGNWDLSTAANGELGALPRIAISASLLFPHYAALRGAARATVANAINLELAGDREGGFALRSALMRTGSRMRTDSSWIIGNLVGQAIAKIGEVRPGGEAALAKDNDNARRSKRIDTEYVAYLKSSGHSDEIPWVVHTSDSAAQIKDIVDHGLETNALSITHLAPLMASWAVSMTVLANLLWVVFVGGVAACLCRSDFVRKGSGLSAKLTVGIALAMIASFFTFAYVTGGLLSEYTLAASSFNRNTSGFDDTYTIVWPRVLVAMVASSVPSGLLWFFAIRSRVKHIPISVGVVRGFASAALPTITVLAFTYSVSVALTGTREASLRPLMIQNMQHEGRFDAAAIGKTWPSYNPPSGERLP